MWQEIVEFALFLAKEENYLTYYTLYELITSQGISFTWNSMPLHSHYRYTYKRVNFHMFNNPWHDHPDLDY